MLSHRVLTALALLAVWVPAILSSQDWPFWTLSLLMVVAGAWEWARLNLAPGWRTGAFMAAVALPCVLTAWPPVQSVLAPGLRNGGWLWGLALLLWVPGLVVALRGGSPSWSRLPASWRAVWGWAMLVWVWWALVQAKAQGPAFILSLMGIVWAADIFAYIGGRLVGRRKLAPQISPGKTWEGVFTGVLGVGLWAAVWLFVEAQGSLASPSYFTRLFDTWPPMVAGGLLLVLVALSVSGDLLESLVKRSAGVKDSSHLLPGHGGVLDRIDALLPVMPVALAFLGSV